MGEPKEKEPRVPFRDLPIGDEEANKDVVEEANTDLPGGNVPDLEEREIEEYLRSQAWAKNSGVREDLDLGHRYEVAYEVTQRPTRELPAWMDPTDLSKAGWGVVVPAARRDEYLEKLKPLLDRRSEQAKGRYRVLDYHFPDSGRKFLWSEHHVPPGVLNPKILPYYLLLVGGPEEIPFEVQADLAHGHAVGRIAFEKLEHYEAYAKNVVAAEEEGVEVEKRMSIFSVEDDDATRSLSQNLVDPLLASLGEDSHGWEMGAVRGPEAKASALWSLFGGREVPGVLLVSSHGLLKEKDEERQEELQGAIKGAEDPEFGNRIFSSRRFQHLDVPLGQVVVMVNCFGAGTPRRDHFPYKSEKGDLENPAELASSPFVARMPMELLRRGALAVVGSLDRGWTSSFFWAGDDRVVSAADTFEDFLRSILSGQRIGHALRPIARKRSVLASLLFQQVESSMRRELPRETVTSDSWLKLQWTTCNAARNFILLGDPAVAAMGETKSALEMGGLAGLELSPETERYITEQAETSGLTPSAWIERLVRVWAEDHGRGVTRSDGG